MKICFLADGESVHTRRWCMQFAAQGHEIHLISFKNVEIPNTAVHFVDAGNISVHGGNKKVLLKVPAVRRILKRIQPDILHAHYATSYGIVGALAGFHPYAITALGSDVLVSPKSSRLLRRMLRFAFRRADWLTGMAEHMKTEMIALGAEPGKTDVVPFGVDLNVFNSQGRIKHNKFVVTSTRNFETVYNIPDFLRAIAIASKEIPDMQVNLLGDGSLRASLEQLAAELGIAPICTFYGRIPQSAIADVLRQSDLFVTVSSSDGNNISLNEAMACGVYCIATNIPANRQWIQDEVNGLLVSVNDPDSLARKIVYVHRNLDKLQQASQERNLEIVKNMANWQKSMRDVEEKYRKLVEQ